MTQVIGACNNMDKAAKDEQLIATASTHGNIRHTRGLHHLHINGMEKKVYATNCSKYFKFIQYSPVLRYTNTLCTCSQNSSPSPSPSHVDSTSYAYCTR